VKITITPTGGSAFTLADDSVSQVIGTTFTNGAGGQIFQEGFLAKEKRQVKTTALFRAAYAFKAPRFNLENTLSWITHRVHDKVENCIAFIAFHPDSVPTQGEICLTNQSQTGLITRYLPNAIIHSVECVNHVGVKNKFQYMISAPNPWQNSP
jgi:hypothetical protein